MKHPLGPHRLAALAEALPGRCPICDGGFTHRRGHQGIRARTCARPECVQEWVRLSWLDRHERDRQRRAHGNL